MKKKQLFFIVTILVTVVNLNAMDGVITGKEVGIDLGLEYNRVFNFCGDLAATGSMELFNRYTFKTGLSFGGVKKSLDFKYFFSGQMEILPGTGFCFSLAYIYNGITGFHTHSHSLFPCLSWYGKRAGISAGTNLRFNRFYGEFFSFESMISFSVYVNFLLRENLKAGFRIANFSEFNAGNMGAYNLAVYSGISINENWSFNGEAVLMQSGSVGLGTAFYGIAFRAGMRYVW